MAHGFKTGGRNFPKGHKFSKGQPKLTDEQKQIKAKLEKLSGKIILAKYCIMSYRELLEKMEDDSISTIDLMIMKMIDRCIQKADLPILIWIYSHLGWDSELNEMDKDDIQQARLIIKLDNEGKPSGFEAKEK
jgi:hypothetical protein